MSSDRYKKNIRIDGHPVEDAKSNTILAKDAVILRLNKLEAENERLKEELDICIEIIEDSGVDYDEALNAKVGMHET